ncbi:M20 family metallopeptidase [Adhaeretor mobilis]|uniref:Succinyl-diaminopimelate desuccinylase n=1 Tax=Adhaeretor mobilis TaxID=1930276 RepID=A0A517MTM1_9BACT|nr:M20/M25/M40 family metallo-hydrolase [Adhaeretor mobilis]QDS98230.1 Succinyl-diaminopimelate desuccinylase [Adhaeretor mobilis]
MTPTAAELVQTCNSLIEVPSIDGDRAALQEVVRRIREFFHDVPVEVHEEEFGGYPSIVITTCASKSPKIMLHGHVDVVPGKPEQFRPEVTDERLHGRGAVDMKGFVAVAMHVIRDLALSPYPPSVGLMINTDEEVGGRCGAKHLVQQGWSAEQLINGDGGYGDAVTFAQKGIIQLTVEALVEPGLRYAPWNGLGAADVLLRTVSEGLQQLCPQQNELAEESNWGSTACVLSVETKENGSLPPRKASASIRVYWADDHTGAEVIELARKAFQPLKVTGRVDAERVYLSPSDPDLLHLRDLWQRQLGRPIGIRADNGSSDAKWFAPLGIPILILRMPGCGAHTDNEWLDVTALKPMYQTLHQYITEKSGEAQESDLAAPVILEQP